MTQEISQRRVIGAEIERAPAVRALAPTRVLLVDDDYDAARLVNRRLAWSRLANFEMSWASNLSEGFELLEHNEYDAMLLDLSLPDTEGINTIAAASTLSAQLPILILTGTDSDEFAVSAVRNGAQDFLVKNDQDSRSLPRSVLAAIERQRRLDPSFREAR